MDLTKPVEAALAWLRVARLDRELLPYVPGGDASAEATLLGLGAGLVPEVAGVEALPFSWAHLLLPAVSRDVAAFDAVRTATLERLLAWKGRPVEQEGEVVLQHDTTLEGWPWADGTSAWVEPTAYAVISLRRCGLGAHPRCRQGLALLRDRQCADGGWNYGNPGVLGEALESDVPPTGWAVLALPPGAEVARGLERLRDGLRWPSGTALALGVLAAVAHRQDPGPWLEPLVGRQRADGSFNGRCDTTALAVIALRGVVEGSHVLHA